MLTAILSARKRTKDGKLRAELTVAGRSVLQWQTDFARTAGCERILCLCDAPTSEILKCQQLAESAGVQFHAIRSSLQLVALLRADDQLFVLADGVLVQTDAELERAILTVPADNESASIHPEDFERIDAHLRWAGLLVMRAAPAQQLADLPPDSDVQSILLRLALQAKTPMKDATDFPDRWILITESGEAVKHEAALVQSASRPLVASGPLNALAVFIPQKLAPIGLSNGKIISAGVALVLLLAGLALTVAGSGPLGLVFCALGAFSVTLSRSWEDLSSILKGQVVNGDYSRNFNFLSDVLASLSLIFALGISTLAIASLGLLATGLARIAAERATHFVAPFWNDRALHLAGFALCAVYGALDEAVALFALAALLQIMLAPSGARTDPQKNA